MKLTCIYRARPTALKIVDNFDNFCPESPGLGEITQAATCGGGALGNIPHRSADGPSH
jgi:hypothetical protein